MIDQTSRKLSDIQLFIAPHKCEILKIKNSSLEENAVFHINNQPVNEQTAFKDLGILVSNDLKWSKHISSITHLASITSYQLRRFIKTKNIWTWIQLYKTYIRPKLEFNTPIWSPFLKKEFDSIESIQRKFTKFAFNRSNIRFTNYHDRLYKVNRLSLLNRRIYFDLVLMYKLIHNISNDLIFNDYFIKIHTGYTL